MNSFLNFYNGILFNYLRSDSSLTGLIIVIQSLSLKNYNRDFLIRLFYSLDFYVVLLIKKYINTTYIISLPHHEVHSQGIL